MLDQIYEFVTKYHVLRWGLIGLAVAWGLTCCFKRIWGTWKHKDKCDIIDPRRPQRTALQDPPRRKTTKPRPPRHDHDRRKKLNR